jgi:hypothetical protein
MRNPPNSEDFVLSLESFIQTAMLDSDKVVPEGYRAICIGLQNLNWSLKTVLKS